ncbi:MAG: hypothetical protein BSOLF_1306 [Candidatus Carbobacillus altaicus]|uniref:Uncharacterized protein n=1 Tax=Candidatus Carbonibacillus altaicus TaxID=2163959 RepID=A0A2R6XZM0_9BACL|nr:MAG: hypothetical protein BSOLF_1306 [Candidatus Carbobacillus altaicus]
MLTHPLLIEEVFLLCGYWRADERGNGERKTVYKKFMKAQITK